MHKHFGVYDLFDHAAFRNIIEENLSQIFLMVRKRNYPFLIAYGEHSRYRCRVV